MIVHYRPIFIVFVSLCFGLWLAQLSHYYSYWILYSILIVFAVLLLLAICYYIFKKVKIFKPFAQIKCHTLTIIIPIIIGVGLFHICMANYNNLSFTPKEDATYGIYGTVSTNYIEKEKGVYFILSNAQVLNEGQYTTLDYNVFVYMYYKQGEDKYSEEDLKLIMPGNRVAIYSQIKQYKIFDDSQINTFAYSNNCQYSAFTYLDNVIVEQGSMKFWDATREYIRSIYKDYMSDRYAGLAFSILVGDRTELADDIAYNFQISGIMHVVAVSGLNTAFIMMLLLFVLNKLRAKKPIKIAVVVIVLLFYALLCKMTPSVVRASLMSIFLLISHLYGKQHDNLNSISLSGILVLLIYPMSLFDLGFLLSYLGVFGIFFLYKPLWNMLNKIHCPKLTDAIALTLAATISTTPIIINAFGYVSLIGLVANLVLVPLFGFAFMALFAITILALIIPFAGYLLAMAEFGFWVVDKGAWILASVPYAAITVKSLPTWSFIGYYISNFSFSRYCVAKPAVKYSIATISILLFCVGFVASIVL